MIGIPFPNIKDTKIVVKRHYYVPDENKWLVDQTIRAVNQSLGRAIRHANDFGALYLVDIRYTQGFRKRPKCNNEDKFLAHNSGGEEDEGPEEMEPEDDPEEDTKHNKYTSRISFWLRDRLKLAPRDPNEIKSNLYDFMMKNLERFYPDESE